MDRSNEIQSFLKQVSATVGAHRRSRGWSQETLAARMGLAPKSIAKLESGRSDLRLSTVLRLADALDVAPAQLLQLREVDVESASVRHRGPLHGLAQAGWRRAKRGTAGAIAVLDVKPRAAAVDVVAEPLQVAWATPPDARVMNGADIFVAQVRDDSMAPIVQDGDWCLFSRHFVGLDWIGKLVLLREPDGSGCVAWSVKKVQAVALEDGDFLILQVVAANPDYPVRYVRADLCGDVAVAAVVVELLTKRRRVGRNGQNVQ